MDGFLPVIKRHIESGYAFVWLVIVLALGLDAYAHQQEVLNFPHLSHALAPWDPDIWMRLSKIYNWLSGAPFYDHGVPETNAPFGGITTPWTRPVDFIVVLFAKLVPGDMNLRLRLLLAATWEPAVLSLGAVIFLTAAGQNVYRDIHVLICGALLLLTDSIQDNYFASGNVDHHNLLIMLWCGVLYFLMKPFRPAVSAGIGVFLGLMMWISPEVILEIGFVYAILGFLALLNPPQVRNLALLATATAATTALALLAEVPPAQYSHYILYDTLSVVHVSVLSFSAVAAWTLTWLFARCKTLQGRAVAAGIVTVLLLALVRVLFPPFFHNPYEMYNYFFKEVLFTFMEAKPIYNQGPQYVVAALMLPVIAYICLFASTQFDKNIFADRQRIIFGGMLLMTSTLIFFQSRWNYYLQPVAILVIATQLPQLCRDASAQGFRWLQHLPALLRPYAWLGLILVTVSFAASYIIVKDETAAKSAGVSVDFMGCQNDMRLVIQTGQLEKLLGDSTHILLTPTNVAGDVIFFTPYHVIAGNYHRESQYQRDLKAIISTKTAAEARPLMKTRKVDAVFVCPGNYPPGTWVHDLAQKHPAWLLPQNIKRDRNFASKDPVLLFKVAK